MTGLFDALNARFAPGGLPVIRARPVSRFEGELGGELSEEEATRPAEVASEPVSESRRVQAGPVERENARRDEPSHENAASAPENDQGVSVFQPDEQGEGRELSRLESGDVQIVGLETRKPTEVSGEAMASDVETPASEVIIETRETLREERTQVIEAPTVQPAPVAPSEIITTVQSPSEASESQAPVAGFDPEPPLPTIRIGRIDVRQPAKSQAPPAPKPTPRREPPAARRMAQSQGGSKGRLTDYLGWKA